MGIQNASSLKTSSNKGQTSAGALQPMNLVAADLIDLEIFENIQKIQEANHYDGDTLQTLSATQ